MNMVPILAASWAVTSLAVLFVIVCILMMLVILIQKPKGGGLSGAFGGGGGSAQSAFGAKTGDFLTWFTVAMFVCFILLAMCMQWAIRAGDTTEEDGVLDVGVPAEIPVGSDSTEPPIEPAQAPVTPSPVTEAGTAPPVAGSGTGSGSGDTVPAPSSGDGEKP